MFFAGLGPGKVWIPQRNGPRARAGDRQGDSMHPKKSIVFGALVGAVLFVGACAPEAEHEGAASGPTGVLSATSATSEVAGTSHRLPSGPLHDAAEVARAGVPTVMLFVQSLRGLSHTKLEDTKPEHLELSVEALDRLATKTIDRLAAG